MLRLKKSLTSLRNWAAQQDDPAPPVPALNLEEFSDWQVIDADEEDQTVAKHPAASDEEEDATAVEYQNPLPRSSCDSVEEGSLAKRQHDSKVSLKDSMFSSRSSGNQTKLEMGTELCEISPSSAKTIEDENGPALAKKSIPSAISLRQLLDELRESKRPSTNSPANRPAFANHTLAPPHSSTRTVIESSRSLPTATGISSNVADSFTDEYRDLEIDDCRDLRYNPKYHECMCIAHQVERSDNADWDAIFAHKPEPISVLKSEVEDEDGFLEVDSETITIHVHGQEVETKKSYGLTCDGTCPPTCPSYQYGLAAGAGRAGKWAADKWQDTLGGGIF